MAKKENPELAELKRGIPMKGIEKDIRTAKAAVSALEEKMALIKKKKKKVGGSILYF